MKICRWVLFAVFGCFLGTAVAQELLKPEEAFRLSVEATGSSAVVLNYQIAPGYYLYRERFKFATTTPGAVLGDPQFPVGQKKHDEFFGDVETYHDDLSIALPIQSKGTGQFSLSVTHQGCADVGVCYPPETRTVDVNFDNAGGGMSRPSETMASRASADESSSIKQVLQHSSLWWVVLTFFGLGLVLALNPCNYPMIPILSAMIVRHGHALTRTRALMLSLAYVLGSATVYAAGGVTAGLAGKALSAFLQNPWVLGSFAGVMAVLSLSMFGFYDLQMPTFLQSKLSDEARHQKPGSLHGSAAMGAISALILGPCMAAPLAGALLYIAQTRDAWLGGTALFVMAVGMGVPLLLIGVSAGTLLPKSGPWMESVKRFFGVLLLATAVWIVSPVIAPIAQMLAWSVLAIFSAIYLRALDPLPLQAHGWQRFGKAFGVVLLIVGTALLLSSLAGGRDPLQPLSFLHSTAAVSDKKIKFERVKTIEELNTRLQTAGKPVMLDFYADWCVSCKEMERFTFSDARVQARLSDVLLLQVDVTENNFHDQALLKKFSLFGPPGILFFDHQGQEISGVKIVGFQSPEDFLNTLTAAGI